MSDGSITGLILFAIGILPGIVAGKSSWKFLAALLGLAAVGIFLLVNSLVGALLWLIALIIGISARTIFNRDAKRDAQHRELLAALRARSDDPAATPTRQPLGSAPPIAPSRRSFLPWREPDGKSLMASRHEGEF